MDKPDEALLKLPEVIRRTGLSRSAIYASPELVPVKIGARSVAWVASEITNFVEARIAARDAARASGKRK
jgi:prophage regulatory protein